MVKDKIILRNHQIESNKIFIIFPKGVFISSLLKEQQKVEKNLIANFWEILKVLNDSKRNSNLQLEIVIKGVFMEDFYKDFNKILKNSYFKSLRLIEFNYWRDIWLGDTFPFFGRLNGEDFGIQFKYTNGVVDEFLGAELFETVIKKDVIQIPLKLDLGNLEFDSNKWFILTEKIFKDNPEFKNDKILLKRFLRDNFEVEKIFIVEQNFELGHVDSFLRSFYDNKFLIREDFLKFPYLKNFVKEAEKFGSEFICVPIFSPFEEKNKLGIENYIGNNNDFLFINNTILFPLWDKNSEKYLKILEKELVSKNIEIIPMTPSIGMEQLYHLGGGYYCITGIN